MTTKHKHDNPILVTGAAGAVGGVGRNLTEFLLASAPGHD
jgi:nucleoside-diphosphate-sugar epimerase